MFIVANDFGIQLSGFWIKFRSTNNIKEDIAIRLRIARKLKTFIKPSLHHTRPAEAVLSPRIIRDIEPAVTTLVLLDLIVAERRMKSTG
ncbi:MAG: hypothetical protein QME59_05945 [Candidatus Hydrothermarchaeota archaeon]|nr:hypothetical protein [Candidatus Hydrothermarchaeota archaeon]